MISMTLWGVGKLNIHPWDCRGNSHEEKFMNVEMIQDQLNNAVTFFKAFENISKGLEFFYTPQAEGKEATGIYGAIKGAFEPLSSSSSNAPAAK